MRYRSTERKRLPTNRDGVLLRCDVSSCPPGRGGPIPRTSKPRALFHPTAINCFFPTKPPASCSQRHRSLVGPSRPICHWDRDVGFCSFQGICENLPTTLPKS